MSVDSSSNLCEKCKVLDFDDSVFGWKDYTIAEGEHFSFEYGKNGWFLDYELDDSTPDFPHLSSSAREGCDFCSLLITAINESGFSGLKFSLRLEIRAGREGCDKPGLRALVAHLKTIQDEKEESEAFLMFTIDSTPGSVRDWIRLSFSPEAVALCPQNLQRLQESLKITDSGQSVSNELPSDGYLPSRLIDLECQDDSECRLVTFGKKPASFQPPYAALSYCWGNEEDARTQFKTTRDTIDSRARGFAIDMTPPAIRDAIEVTRALGIRYLWIDAVCIVQDDKEDWEGESKEMAAIYQHAYLTICAAASESCRQGFLERSNRSICVNFQSVTFPSVRGTYTLCWYGTIEQPHYADYDYNQCDVMTCNWNTRGWTFQEMRLSQRLLVFGRRKLHFWSKTLCWMENEATRSWLPDLISCNSVDIDDLDQKYLSCWLRLIELYTARVLTNHSDKLPAISGLASLASGGQPERYYAGIREGQMYRDLMWAAGDTQDWKRDKMSKASLLNLLQSPNRYIAPSWSWASHHGGIATSEVTGRQMFGYDRLENFVKEYDKLEARTRKSGLNPYGQISDGALEFSGSVMALSKPLSRARDRRWNMREHWDTNYSILLWLDWHPDGDDEPIDDLSCILLGTCHPPGTEIYQKGVASDWPADPYFHALCMRDEEAVAFGLVIHPAGKTGKFCRVGIWTSLRAPQDGSAVVDLFRNRPRTDIVLI